MESNGGCLCCFTVGDVKLSCSIAASWLCWDKSHVARHLVTRPRDLRPGNEASSEERERVWDMDIE